MARTDNLVNFVTDICNATRTKTGKTDAIPLNTLDTEIESIVTGGGEPNLQDKNITITTNGITNITADSDYDGLGTVSVTTDVSTLPLLYTELEYLENDPALQYNQYLQTTFKLTSNSRVICKFSRDIQDNSGLVSAGTIGSYKNNVNCFMQSFRINNKFDNRFECYYGNQTWLVTNIKNVTDFVIDYNKNHWTIYDFDNNKLAEKTFNEETFVSDYTTPIMTNKVNSETGMEHGFFRLYYIQIYDNDTLLYDIIPVKLPTGVVCAYNKVDKTFMYNTGIGAFIAGPTKENVHQTLQDKSVEITENGTTTVLPDEGYQALSSVNVTTNVASTGTTSTTTYKVENVNFIDYDGTVLYSYPLDVVKNMTELPPLPTGGTYPAKMWNWTLEEIIERNEPADVGVIYDIDDDIAIILKVHVTEFMINKETFCNFRQYTTKEKMIYDIDWGDGSEHTSDSIGSGGNIATKVFASHIYTQSGNYIVTIRLIDAIDQRVFALTYVGSYNFSQLWSDQSASSFNSSTYGTASPWWKSVTNVVIGPKFRVSSGCTFISYNNLASITISDTLYRFGRWQHGNEYQLQHITIPRTTEIGSTSSSSTPTYMFGSCFNLKSISMPATVPTMQSYGNVCSSCYSLKKSILPKGFTTLASQYFYNCHALEYVSIPDTITTIGNNAFQNCYSLKHIIIPDTVTTINSYAFNNCFALEEITFSQNITEIPGYCLSGCRNLKKIVLPHNVTKINANAFTNVGITRFDFSQSTTIPTVETNSFQTDNLKIIIPDSLYDEWITTGNWTTYATYCVKASEIV